MIFHFAKFVILLHIYIFKTEYYELVQPEMSFKGGFGGIALKKKKISGLLEIDILITTLLTK